MVLTDSCSRIVFLELRAFGSLNYSLGFFRENLQNQLTRIFLMSPTGPQEFLLLTKRSEISILSLSTEERTELKLPITDIGHVIAVDFDPVQKSLYWIDSQYHEIKCASINGSGNVKY